MAKIVVMGVDGFDPELVKKWAEDLPHLMKMQADGIWGDLQSTVPPTTALAWGCAQTGVNPGELGFWDVTYRKAFSYQLSEVVNLGKMKPAPLYKYLSYKRAKKVGIISVPNSWPPPEVPGGYAISDDTRPASEQGYTWPKSLSNEVRDIVGDYIVDISGSDGNYLMMDRDLAKERAHEMDDQRLKLLKHFIEFKQCDYIFCVLMGVNRLSHLFYHFCDKTHKRYEYNKKYENILKEHYQFIDEQIGEILSLLDSRTALLVHSAYSLQKLDGRIHLNEWLLGQGYLVLEEYPERPTELNQLKIDWNRTRAWSAGSSGQIYLNIEGREANGIVSPGEAESLMTELTEKIAHITDEKDSLLKTEVFRRDGIHRGVLSKFGPDLFVVFEDGRWVTSDELGYGKGKSHSYETPQGIDYAAHGSHGYFCGVGPGVPREGELKGVTLLDVAPTVLSIMGEVPPDMMEGKSLVEIDSSPDEEGKLEDRLAALGY